jgi:hypothetical protein
VHRNDQPVRTFQPQRGHDLHVRRAGQVRRGGVVGLGQCIEQSAEVAFEPLDFRDHLGKAVDPVDVDDRATQGSGCLESIRYPSGHRDRRIGCRRREPCN